MKLALFFTFRVSLKEWLDKGLFDREKLLYEKLLQKKILSNVLWFTYGPKDDRIAAELKQAGRLNKDIEILPMPAVFNFTLGKFIYSLMMPAIMKKYLKQTDIYKTNQMSGSWSAVLAKKLLKKPLIVRTGYTWSRLKESQKISSAKKLFIRAVERFAYKNSDYAVVTTKSQAEYIKNNYAVSDKSIFIIPNYIDTDLFSPDSSIEKYPDRLIFVGRISNEKNLINLVTAVAKAKMCLDIYGSGDIDGLNEHIRQTGAKINFKGSVANELLPGIFNKYKFFVLPSFAESLPKSLLEALACGLVCIGTDVTGINEVITDGVNGWLAKGTDADSIFEAIQKAVNSSTAPIAQAAVETVKSGFSIESVIEKYSQILSGVKK